MKKITKATIATAAGVALLLGTGGTLAYWNDQASLAGTTITAGNLALTAKGTPTWTLQHTSGAATPISTTELAALKIVPGDKLVYTGAYTVAAQGKDLVFKADITPGAIAAATPGKAVDDALAARIARTATYTINGTAGQTATIKHRSDAAATYDVVIAVTLDWPFTADGSKNTADNAAKLGSVSLANFAVAVTQLDGTTTP